MSVDDGLRPLFRRHVPQPVHWQSIETGMVSRGVADSNYCADGAEGWIEHKATKGWTVGMRPEQVGWLTTRARHGGRVFVAVRRRVTRGPQREAADELYLLAGAAAREIKDNGLPRPSRVRRYPDWVLGVWPGGPWEWDWRAVRAILTASST